MLALAVRAVGAFGDGVLFNDAPEFIRIAELLERGDLRGALAHPFHPFTSVLMAALDATTGLGLETAGHLVSVVSGGVATAALYALTRAGLGPRVAFVTALLFAVHPRLVASSSSVQSDGLHVALFLLAALLSWRALATGRTIPAVAAGLGCALAYLTRPEGILVATLFGFWLVVLVLSRRLAPSRAAALGIAFAVVFVLVAGPYWMALSRQTGEWTLTQKKSAAGILQLGRPIGPQGSSLASLGPGVGEVLRDGARAMNGGFLVLLVLGLRRGRPTRHTLFLLSYVGLLALVLLGLRLDAGYVSRRHWLTGVALLLPFAGRGLVDSIPAFAGRWISPVRVRRLAGALVLGFVGGFAVDAALDREDPVKLARKEAALWLRRSAAPRVVAAPRSRVAYYAGAARAVPLPDPSDLRSFARALDDSGAEFVIAEESRVPPELHGGEVHRVPYPGGVVLVLRLGASPRPQVGVGP